MPTRLKQLGRREVLAALGAGVGAALVGCSTSPTSPNTTSSSSSSSSGACAVIPSETEGPYPDMTGMISNPAFFRRDITEGRAGLPLTLRLTLVNVSTGCTPIAGYNIEVWQCDAAGNYSEYQQPGFNGTGQTFLRGVQTTDSSGVVTFNTIYPGWYQGRATHIHVDVFRGTTLVKSTQIAFPEDVTRAVYATGVYAAKGQSPTSNSGDMVFSDGVQLELASLTGSTASGYTATLQVGINA